ncbi:MAG: protein-L-isoaspartate O-methyltransferase [Sphingopyxis sp.]|nr:protein-L-isoaspartate O-methyltransferase [Sphingopyxis sp.]
MATQLREASYADMRAAMVDCQLRTNDVIDPALIAAMGRVPREKFVPEALAAVAYIDRPIALDGTRRMNPPLVTARLLVAAEIAAGHRVLLVGAATGYAAAILQDLGAEVIALESDAALAAAARTALGDLGVTVTTGQLAAGVPGDAPFDRIVLDGAIEQLPDALAAQLAEGGVLVCALREGAVTRLARGVKVAGTLTLRPFADMDAAALPGFVREKGFTF